MVVKRTPPSRFPGKEKDVKRGLGHEARGLNHPLRAFNKSIQATRGLHTCGPNHRRMCRGWECAAGAWGGQHMEGSHCSILDWPMKTGREEEEEAGSEALIEKSSGTGESKTNPLHNLPL